MTRTKARGRIMIGVAGSAAADVTISYAVSLGVRHPASTTCVIPAPATWDGPTLTATRPAHGAGLAAAVRHAAAAEALRVIEAEALATRHRLRAIRDSGFPGSSRRWRK